MKFYQYLFTAMLLTHFWGEAHACSPITIDHLQNRPATMLLSPNGRYLLKRIPGVWAKEKGNTVLKRSPYTLAFELLKNGQLKQIWSVKRAFALSYLSNDGLSVMEIRAVSSHLHNAVTLYNRGRQVSAYKVINLGVTQHMLRPLPCGKKRWIHPKEDSVKRTGESVSVRTVDGKKHVFSLTRGVKIR